MGTSAFDVLKNQNNPSNATNVQTPAPSPQSGGGSAFSALVPDVSAPPKVIGFWDKISNVIDNLVPKESPQDTDKKLAAQNSGSYANLPETDPLLNKIKKANEDGKAQQALSMAGADIKNTFTTSKGIAQLGSDVADAAKNTVKQVFDNPSGTIKSIPSSLLEMVNSPLKALSGIDLMSSDAPEESVQARVQDIKDTAAQIAAGIATEGMSKALEVTPLKASKTIALPEMAMKSSKNLSGVLSTSTTLPGNLAKSMVKGGLDAGAGGAAYGLVSGANEPDQIDRVVGSAIQFAPLGAMVHALVSTKPELKNAQANNELANLVQNKRDLDFKLNDSMKDVANTTSALVTSDDLADAVVKNKILDFDKSPMVVQGVTKSKLATLPDELPYDVHTFGDGSKVDVMLVPKDLKLDPTSFKISGYMDGETISYQGSNYRLDHSTPTDATLISPSGDKMSVPLDQIRRTNDGMLLDPEKILDQQYQSLKSQLTGPSGDWYQVNSQDIVDKFKGLSYPKQLYYANRLGQDILKSVPGLFDQENLENFYSRVKPKNLSVGTYEDFINQAQTNGYKVDIGDAGKIVLKDMSDDQGRVIASGNSIGEAMDFLNKSGQAKGEDLTTGLQDPIGTGAKFKSVGEVPNPNKAEPIPFLQSPLEWTGQKIDQIDRAWKSLSNKTSFIAHWFTPASDVFKVMDNMYGTSLHSQIYDATQLGKQASISAADPWIKDKLSVINKAAKGMSLNELQTAMSYMETMSPKSVIDKGFSTPLTSLEQELATKFDDNESIQKAFNYNAFIRDHPGSSPDIINSYTKNMGIDDKAFGMAKLMDQIKEMSSENADLNKIIRLARATNDGGLDRPEFAAKNNMTSQHIGVANALEDLTKELAPVFGISPKEMINNWMTHARLYSAGDLTGAMNLFNRPDNPEANPFYSKLARTGEIDSYERNPIVAAFRYIKGGFDSLHYADAEAAAKKYLKDVLSVPESAGGLIPDAEKAKVQNIVESYMNDLRGRTPIMSAATESAVKGFLDTHIPSLSVSARNTIVGLNKVVQIGTQGFKVAAGVRDLMAASGLVLVNFGPERLKSILEKGAIEVANGNSLIKEGHLSGLTLDNLSDPSNTQGTSLNSIATGVKGALNKIGEVSLKASGQEGVFNLFRQGAYMDTFTRVAEAARQLRAGDIDQDGFLKAINADKDFDPSIKAEIVKQLNQSPQRLDELAKYLGRESARQVTPSYGSGNNPTGWGRNIGKVLGQYGTYSSWLLSNIKSAVSRGSIGDRLARGARFATYTGSVAAASQATGLNFSPWYIHRFGFAGGPLGQLGMNLYNAVGSTGYEQKTAADQLSRLLPFQNGEFKKQFYIPASFAFSDLSNAVQGSPTSLIGINPEK